VMQVKGGQQVTLTPGQTFYEGPDDVHVVDRNASRTQPAKFLVFLIKDKGGLCCKNEWECEKRIVSARYAANPNSWLMARFWARTSPLAIPLSWPLRSMCIAS
jgi:hypothetical protein